MGALRFGVVSTGPQTGERLAAFCQALERATGQEFAPVVLTSYVALLDAVVAGDLEVAWAPPLIAVDLEDRRAAHALVVVQRSVRSGYYSALFVHGKSGLRRVEDLKGVSVGWVSRESASGYVVPRWHMRSLGIRVDHAFSSQKFLSTHEAVTQAVLDREVDVGATHVGLDAVSGKLKSAPWLNLGMPASSIRVILLVGPIPGDLVMASSRLASSVRQRLTAALLAVREGERGEATPLFEASRFEPVSEGHLDLLRRLSRFDETRA